jgi:hypothetical protein
MQQVVDTIVKRAEKFTKDKFQDWKFKLEMAVKGSGIVMASLLDRAESQELTIGGNTNVEAEDRDLNYNFITPLPNYASEKPSTW